MLDVTTEAESANPAPLAPIRHLPEGTPSAGTDGAAAAVVLPRDDGPHDAVLEWWYYTGHLSTDAGEAWGFEAAFFKLRSEPDFYLCNLAITDHQTKRFAYSERVAIHAVTRDGFGLDIGGWTLRGHEGRHQLVLNDGNYALDVELKPEKPAVLQGEGGVQRTDAAEGRYYSRTRLRAWGTLRYEGRERVVAGIAWMDHQWFQTIDGSRDVGWDWFSIQLEGSVEIMLAELRIDGTSRKLGTWVDPMGHTAPLTADEVFIEPVGKWTNAVSGNTYPMGWIVRIPCRDVRLELTPVLADQELHGLAFTPIDYWEGEVEVSGAVQGTEVQGVGYVELTGYAPHKAPKR